MSYDIKQARKEAFEQFHQTLNTPERLEKIVKTLDNLLDTGTMRLQAFTVGVLIDVLFQPDEDGVIIRSHKPNTAYNEKLSHLAGATMIGNDKEEG